MLAFSQTAEAVAQTSSKLEKMALLGQYFSTLSDEDLTLAARYFTGRIFPLYDERVTNIGYAQVAEALLTLVPESVQDLERLAVEWGDMGDVAFVVLGRRAPQPLPHLTLAQAQAVFDQFAGTRGAKAKSKLLIGLLEQATALEGKYLVKILMGDLRIGTREGVIEDALARLAGETVGRVQWVNMLLGDMGETAVLARHGQLDQARMRLFHPIKFMLASPIEDPAEISKAIAGEFIVEDKYDGIRAQAHKQGQRVALYSRTLDEITHRFPELHQHLLALPGEFVLDGEIVAYQAGSALSFKALQQRLGRKTVGEDLLNAVPVAYFAFDCLYQNGKVFIEESLEIRWQALASLGLETPLLLAQHRRHTRTDEIRSEFALARDRGNEGLMIKDPQSAYKPGRRGKEWLKVKQPLATLDVVVTGVEWGNGKRRKVLSDYTFAVRASETSDDLLNVGKAYSGLTDAEIAEMTEWFKAHTIRDFGKFRLVEPQIVLEVAFDAVQASARHKSGYALRFPRIVRLRPDKLPAEIDTLDAVKRLAGEVKE